MIFNFRHCETYLDAYLDHDLPPRKRQWVARHLDQCPDCYRAYRQKRDLRAELQRSVPLVGQRQQPDFGALWTNIQREIPQPPSIFAPVRMRFGLTAIAVMVMFLLPFTMGHRDARLALPPTYPLPVSAATEAAESTEPVAEATQVASLTLESKLHAATSVPTLPEPVTHESARGLDGNHN